MTGLPTNDSCYVAYSDNYLNIRVKALGNYTFPNVSPNGSIMVYDGKMMPYIAPLKIQNQVVESSQYILASFVEMGNHIESNRTFGDVVIKDGAELILEAKGKSILNGGVKIEKGAKFSINKASY